MKTLNQNILAMYLGQKMIFEKSGRITTLQGVQIINGELYLDDGEDFRPYKYFPFKPILRKLSDMTEEEAKKLIRINKDFNRSVSSEYIYLHGKSIWAHIHESAAITCNYLRSIGIDCDGLIDAGLAIHQLEKSKDV